MTFPADDDTLHMTAALWSGYIRALERTRGPRIILSANDVDAMLELRGIAMRPSGLQERVAAVADRAPGTCPDIDQEYGLHEPKRGWDPWQPIKY